MLIEHIFLGFCGLAAGLAVSAGTFAFLIVIGVIPRMIGKCNRAAETMHFENAVILGGICGNLASVFYRFGFRSDRCFCARSASRQGFLSEALRWRLRRF